MKLKVQGIPSAIVKQIQAGGDDANNQPAQTHVAEGFQNPCRHCLQLITEGSQTLVLSYRPFDTLQPYAETGPIFLHNETCEQYSSDQLPFWFGYMDSALIRGYDDKHWIRYDSAEVIPGKDLDNACRKILADESIAYVHIRSKYNCFQCQVERA